jgi:hypothetical protein
MKYKGKKNGSKIWVWRIIKSRRIKEV